MNSIVFIKQVPDIGEVKIDPVTNNLIRQGIPSVINPFDKNALEEALIQREKHGGKVTVVTMGPPQAAEALKECLATGADEVVHLSDAAFGGSDTLATGKALAAAARKIGGYDLIICGKQATDGDTAQVGPEMAEFLDLPQVTNAVSLTIENGEATVKREEECGYAVLKVKLPLLLTVTKIINEPRLPSIKGRMKANKAAIPVWTAADLGLAREDTGLKASPTKVAKIFYLTQRGQGEIIKEDSAEASAKRLVARLSDAGLLA
ncbi:MAG: electron transfer flavoprotein subunit beta/FixA family protein [Acidaminococcales bacterium]|nr:electron transfer flavoprotein subunit beta/FixA family protein [Acidaminococcales bacterium]